MAQAVNRFKQTLDQGRALVARAMFLRKQRAEALFKTINDLNGGVGFQVGIETFSLLGAKILLVAAHQRKQAAILRSGGINLAPTR